MRPCSSSNRRGHSEAVLVLVSPLSVELPLPPVPIQSKCKYALAGLCLPPLRLWLGLKWAIAGMNNWWEFCTLEESINVYMCSRTTISYKSIKTWHILQRSEVFSWIIYSIATILNLVFSCNTIMVPDTSRLIYKPTYKVLVMVVYYPTESLVYLW